MKILILIFSIVVISQCQVLGIDFGTEFWKASLISPGKNLVIVENSRSGRKTINGIAIMEGVRHFEDDALYKRLKKPHMSYFYLNKLLRSLDFPEPLPQYKFQNGTYYITHKQQQISLEQLVGMILKNIKLHAINQAGSEIKDCVLAVPANWGWRARIALVNAAMVAGLNILGLVNENSAAAINFAITRNDSDPINIGFFNLGSHNLQFSIVQFYGYKDEERNKNIESLRVLSHHVVENVGGLSIDRAIADYLSEQFKKKHGLDPRTNQKAYVKLLHECSEAKQTLSANKEVQVYVEGIMSGIDLNFSLTRELIDSLPIFKQLSSHLDQAMTKAGIRRSQLHSVQMIGGASRIPLISKIIKEHFKQIDVGSHINGDEAMALGSALRAANLSIAFRVKELHFYDGLNEEVTCKIRDALNNQSIFESERLFSKQGQHGDKAYIHLSPPKTDILVDLFYGEELVKTYTSSDIVGWQTVYNSTYYNFTTHPTLVLGFLLSTVDIVDLKEAYINLTYENLEFKQLQDWVEEQQTNQNQQDENNNSPDTQSNDRNKSLDANQTQPDKDTVQSQLNGASNSTSQKGKKLKKITKAIQQRRLQTKKHHINTQLVSCLYHKFSKQQIASHQSLLSQFENHELYLKQKSQIRNQLQSTLYKLRNSYQQPYLTQFSTQQQLQNLKQIVSQKLQWLDQNAWTAQKDDFEKHFNLLFQAYSPIYNRSIQYHQRSKKYNQTIQYLSFTYQKTLQLNQTHSWLQDKIFEHLNKINSTVQYIHQQLKKQSDQQLYINPLLYNHEMIRMAQQLRDQYYLMRLIPKTKNKIHTKKHEEQHKKQQHQENSQTINDSEEKTTHQNQQKQEDDLTRKENRTHQQDKNKNQEEINANKQKENGKSQDL